MLPKLQVLYFFTDVSTYLSEREITVESKMNTWIKMCSGDLLKWFKSYLKSNIMYSI